MAVRRIYHVMTGTTGSITLGTVSGGTTPYAYTWTTSDGTIPAGQENNANPTGLTAGTYNYSVTDNLLVLHCYRKLYNHAIKCNRCWPIMAARRMYYVMLVQPVPSRWEQSVAEQHRMLTPGQQAMEQYLQVRKMLPTQQV